jgi:hypothetical protein
MEEKTSETGGKQVLRDEGGRFVKGVSGNPSGSPKGRRTALVEIEEAIEEFQRTEGVSYWHAATVLAMKLAEKGNATLLAKLIDKFLPSKFEADVTARPVVMMPSIIKNGKPLEFNIGSGPEEPKDTE